MVGRVCEGSGRPGLLWLSEVWWRCGEQGGQDGCGDVFGGIGQLLDNYRTTIGQCIGQCIGQFKNTKKKAFRARACRCNTRKG